MIMCGGRFLGGSAMLARRGFLLMAGLAVSWPALAAGELTVAEIEAVSRLAGVRAIAKGAVPGAQGAQNFVGADGNLLLIVSLGAAKDYRDAREAFGKRTAIGGLGDEAFHPSDFDHAVYARKGERMVGLGSGLDARTGKSILSQAQLQALAKLVVGRL